MIASLQGWRVDIPLWVAAGGMGVTLLIGGIAGPYPAVRAGRLPPKEELAAGNRIYVVPGKWG